MIQQSSDTPARTASADRGAVKISSDHMFVGRYELKLDPLQGAVLQTLPAEDQITPEPRAAPVLVRPQSPGDFFDRDDETSQATAALEAGESVDLYGPEGVGKTALISFLAQNVPGGAFPDGIVYQRTGGRSADDILQSLFDDFYTCDDPFKPMREQLRHSLRDKQALVLLDDVDLKPREVESMMNVLPRSVFVVAGNTSQLAGDGRPIPLSGLPLGDAITLLERELGDQDLEPDQIPLAQRVCKALECRPLRIRQAAALIREDGVSLEKLARELTSPQEFRKLVLESIRDLSASQQQVLGVLATLDGAVVTTQRLGAITKVPNAQQVCEALRLRGLAEAVGDDYRLCREVTDAIREKVSPEWTIKLILYYRKLVEQHRNDPAHLLPEIDAILQTLRCVIGCGLWTDAIAIARRIESPLALAGQWDAWGQVLEAALLAARKIEDRREEAWALHQQGVRALCLDNAHTAKTQLATALRMRTAQGDTVGAATTQQNFDLVQEMIGSVHGPFETGQQPKRTSPWAIAGIGLAAVLLAALAVFAMRRPAETPVATETPLAIQQVAIEKTVRGGDKTLATIVLNRAVAAPSADSTSQTVVELVVDDPNLISVPRTAVVPAGESEVAVPLQTAAVSKTRQVHLTATHAGVGQTATITLKPDLSVKLETGVARGGQIVPGIVTTRAPAPQDGLRIPLKISVENAVRGPSQLWILPGEQEATFELQCLPVSEDQVVKVSAVLEDLQPHDSLTIRAGVPFVLVPPSAIGGELIRGVVTLPKPAPPGGSEFTFAQERSPIRLPANVTVPPGRMFAEFEAATEPVGRSTSAQIRATSGSIEETVHIRLRPDVRFAIEVDPNRPPGFYRGIVTLPVPAPEDIRVLVRRDETYVVPSVPIVIRRGTTTVHFPIMLESSYPTEVAITCDGVERRATTPTIAYSSGDLARDVADDQPPVEDTEMQGELALRVLAREQTDESILAVVNVLLREPAPEGGATVQLTSSDPAVLVPEMVHIPAGQLSTKFAAHSVAGADAVEASITATYDDHQEEIAIAFPPHFDVVMNADVMPGGYSTAGRILMGRVAPPEGAKFELASHDPRLLRVPATVVIPAGLDDVIFEINTAPVATKTDARFTLRHEGVEKTVRLTLVADFEISAEFDASTGRAVGTVQLGAPAPTSGTVIELRTNATRVAQVPADVTIAGGETSANFPITFLDMPQTVTIVGSNAGLRRTFVLVTPVPEAARPAEDRAGPAAGDRATSAAAASDVE